MKYGKLIFYVYMESLYKWCVTSESRVSVSQSPSLSTAPESRWQQTWPNIVTTSCRLYQREIQGK